jgi:hypothetical protein
MYAGEPAKVEQSVRDVTGALAPGTHDNVLSQECLMTRATKA